MTQFFPAFCFHCVGYHKKGYPKREPKKLLSPCKYQCQETTMRPRLILQFARGPRRTASDEVPTLRLAEAPSPEAPRRKASDKVPILRLARGWLGNDPVTAASTGFSNKMSRSINASNHSRDVSRASAQYSGVADGTGVTSTPCSQGQDWAGVTGRCARHYTHD